MTETIERRKPFEGYYGCLKTKRGEFCVECVIKATGEYIKHDRRNKCNQPTGGHNGRSNTFDTN